MFKRLSNSKRRGLASDPTGIAGIVPGSTDRPVFNESLERYPEYDIVILGGGEDPRASQQGFRISTLMLEARLQVPQVVFWLEDYRRILDAAFFYWKPAKGAGVLALLSSR